MILDQADIDRLYTAIRPHLQTEIWEAALGPVRHLPLPDHGPAVTRLLTTLGLLNKTGEQVGGTWPLRVVLDQLRLQSQDAALVALLDECLAKLALRIPELEAGAQPAPMPVHPGLPGGFRLLPGADWPHAQLPLDHLHEGSNRSPPVRWEGTPAGTAGFVCVMEALDRGDDPRRYHWIQHSISIDATGLPSDAGRFRPDALAGRDPGHATGAPGQSDFEAARIHHYHGPEPGDQPRRYELRLIALRTLPGRDQLTSSADRLLTWIAEHDAAIASATLLTYARSPFTNRDYLFKDHRFLGRFFGARPWKVFAALVFLAVVCLALPAWLIGLHDLPTSVWVVRDHPTTPPARLLPHDNTGFYFQANWMPLYAIVIPAFFAGCAGFAMWLRRAVQRLARLPGGVIKSPGDRPYALFLRAQLASRARATTIFAAVFTTVVMVIDSYSLFLGYAIHDFSRERFDWAIAHLATPPIDPPRTIVFAILAYAAQAAAIFLFTFVTAKFFVFLRTLSRTIRGKHKDHGYEFEVWLHDDTNRLGLGPLGTSYNAYIALSIGVAAYAVFHRFQLIADASDGALAHYVDRVVGLFRGDVSLKILGELFAVETVTRGMWVIMVALVLPAVVIAYYPLIQIRSYLQAAIEIDDGPGTALNASPPSEQDRQRRRVLRSANLWPNGDRTAIATMSIWLVLFASAIFPPILVVGPVLIVGLGILGARRDKAAAAGGAA